MSPRTLPLIRKVIPIGAAVSVGLFLSISSAALEWSTASTLVVGIALVAMLGLFGTPLLLLDLEALIPESARPQGSREREVAPQKDVAQVIPDVILTPVPSLEQGQRELRNPSKYSIFADDRSYLWIQQPRTHADKLAGKQESAVFRNSSPLHKELDLHAIWVDESGINSAAHEDVAELFKNAITKPSLN